MAENLGHYANRRRSRRNPANRAGFLIGLIMEYERDCAS
jgi:hypothetical protein